MLLEIFLNMRGSYVLRLISRRMHFLFMVFLKPLDHVLVKQIDLTFKTAGKGQFFQLEKLFQQPDRHQIALLFRPLSD